MALPRLTVPPEQVNADIGVPPVLAPATQHDIERRKWEAKKHNFRALTWKAEIYCRIVII